MWLHFSLANAACRSWLRHNLDLPDAFHDTLQEGAGSTRLEREGDALLAVVHDVLFDFTFDAGDVSTDSLCVQPQVMVSARLKPLRSLDRLRAAVKAGDGFGSPAGLLAQLLRDQAGVLADVLRQATGRVDEIEDKLLQEELAAAVSERTGRTLFVLTIVTVLALPINLLAGLFGMNVGGIPFAEDSGGFRTVVAMLVVFTAAVGYLALRKFRE